LAADNKLIIYQMLPRLFGNTNQRNKFYGSIEENGSGKLSDINDKALQEFKSMGFTHVWYTGVVRHATMTDYSAFGIPVDDPDVVKGRAGSPYAVNDYYDIDPDLAVDVRNRMSEFELLIKRSHDNALKVIMDFVPNHVARTYVSVGKPDGVRDFGADDDNTKAFSPTNDLYYTPNQAFVVPKGYNPGGDEFVSPLKDGQFAENPAKATGNDKFTPSPSINDWFETVKLNYGVDYLDYRKTYFDPVPPLWNKMYHILHFWSTKGIDGFRCDMVEMVPVEFWGWVTAKLKAEFSELIFIGEAYEISKYNDYIFKGGFDYLYDKVGLYDAIRKLTNSQWDANTWDINQVWNRDCKGIDANMLRFMENHDEQRVASKYFGGDGWNGVPGMIVTATLNTGPVMIYMGQEVAEKGSGYEGFSNDDGRTTIFDYWGVPEHQKWLNNGLMDGGQLSDSQKRLREFYSKLLNICRQNEAIREGEFWELMLANEHQPGFDKGMYLYLRYTGKQRILVIANFNREERNICTLLPADLLQLLKLGGACQFTDLLSGTIYHTDNIADGVAVKLPAMNGVLLEF